MYEGKLDYLCMRIKFFNEWEKEGSSRSTGYTSSGRGSVRYTKCGHVTYTLCMP